MKSHTIQGLEEFPLLYFLEKCAKPNEKCNPSATGKSGDPRCCTPFYCNAFSKKCEEFDNCKEWADRCDPLAQPKRGGRICCQEKDLYCNKVTKRCERMED